MSIFSLFKKQKSLLPKDRFSFMPVTEQQVFIREVTEYFLNKPGFTMDFENGVIHGDDGFDYGLDNVAQVYFQVDHAEKSGVIRDHFDGILKGRKEEKEILKNRTDFGKMKKYIAVRLYPPDYLHATGKDGMLYKEDLEGILTALVLDLPSTVIIVKPEDAAKWKVTIDELFTLAFKNTYANNKVEITKEKFAEDAVMWVLGSETNLFASASVFRLSKYPQVTGKYGSLVSIPHRHMILAVPIHDKSILPALNQFMVITNGLFQQGPGSISPNIFWYHKETFTTLPYTISAKNLEFSPPAAFIEVLNKVAEEK